MLYMTEFALHNTWRENTNLMRMLYVNTKSQFLQKSTLCFYNLILQINIILVKNKRRYGSEKKEIMY